MAQCILCGEAGDFMKGNDTYCKDCAEIEFGDARTVKLVMPIKSVKKKKEDFELKIDDEWEA